MLKLYDVRGSKITGWIVKWISGECGVFCSTCCSMLALGGWRNKKDKYIFITIDGILLSHSFEEKEVQIND